ncbi:PLP-dependent transferase [uncultured Roseovarius sp.]|uniref:PLP-dependent transferase n=1 Tax=uncultured Roseovarius sp. TaxID=293344 RepID=UPI00260B7808|nr:PLP-dependent transferase [uncultured Roseovarius sp.]
MTDLALRQLSPLRNSTNHSDAQSLASEQARHFGIDTNTEYGETLVRLAASLYDANVATHELMRVTMDGLKGLDRNDRIAWFNAKRFICFQLAKILDTLQNPMRATYQSITTDAPGFASKGPYPIFDNVAAIFSANPVITRTATYLFACTEWVEDAFTGREPLHEIYSRLMNPTSISLANHIIDVECGSEANQYMAWNFNSGMAAIDGVLGHVIGRDDIILASRNIYGGAYQLLHDWYAKPSNMNAALVWVDGFDGAAFEEAMDSAAKTYANRIANGRKVYIYLESPCNPHGYVLDVPAISRAAHERGWQVICDSTVGTPFLHPLLKNPDRMERPDFIMHSYTKDLAGFGTTTAGCVIARNEDMFVPKNESVTCTWPDGSPRTVNWNETLFWNVFYIKGAFLDADKAFEVLNGMKTFEMRVLQKAINTTVLARAFDAHPDINVSCPVIEDNDNHEIAARCAYLGLPAGLFTIDMEGKGDRPSVPRATFKRFFDMLEPAVGMQVSLGQTTTVALCPAMTTHSEMSDAALREATIEPTTTRISVGLEDPRVFLAHIQRAAEVTIDPEIPGFSSGFPDPEEIDRIFRETTLSVHRSHLERLPTYSDLLS